MNGISHSVNLIDAEPTSEQIAVYSVLIRSLRNLPYEHVVFDFQESDKADPGLQYYQLCRGEKELHVEVCINAPSFKMYAKTVKDEEAIELLREMINTRETPDISDWEDITERVRSIISPDE